MRTTICLGCGNPTTNGSRCPTCAGGYRSATRNRAYDTTEWRKKRRRELAAHIATYGYWCPGWRRPAHPARDLTLDHTIPLSRGGALLGPTTVLCRSCNDRKGTSV